MTKAKAEAMGKAAFEAGLGRAPILNPEFMDAIEGGNASNSVECMKAYHLGWASACINAPIN